MSQKEKLLLVDGSNYLHRAFYALGDLSNSRGFPTNAIYVFTNMLLKLLKTQKPDYLVMVFDVKGPTFRHEAYAPYKATRKAMPEALAIQIPLIKEIVAGFSIKIVERQGFEADDIIGTIARREAARGLSVVIVSGDKDLMQLVTPDITLADTLKDISYDVEAVKSRFGVPPEKIPEVLGLMGDAVDNIPGVPGIGPKTARELIAAYGSVEGVLAGVDGIRGRTTKRALVEHAGDARLSRDLAVIKTDLPLDLSLADCRLGEPKGDVLKGIFTELEFSSLLQELPGGDDILSGNYHYTGNRLDLTALREKLAHAAAFSLEVICDGPPLSGKTIGLAFCIEPKEAFFVPLAGISPEDREDGPAADEVLPALEAILSSPKVTIYGHDLKTASLALFRHGINLAGIASDTMVAAYILNPTGHGFDLADLLRSHLGARIISTGELLGNGARAIPFDQVEVDRLKIYACLRADGAMRLAGKLDREIREAGLASLYSEIEIPLIPVLRDMEARGVLVDGTRLKSLSSEMEEALDLSQKQIYALAGERFNVNSPKQLQGILYDKLKLPRGRKIKEGFSTDFEVLTALAEKHELPAEILVWRSLIKLKTTYVNILPRLINPRTGRIHTSYNQTVTATGRLSSSNPNLQNIPIRTPEGRRIRQAFVAPPGATLVTADYSQVELRVLAHLSRDEALIQAFAAGEDIHARTAAEVFGVFAEMVTPDMRRQAKVINFGIIYGMGAFSLAKELGVNQNKAQAYIDNYFRNFSGVKGFLDETLTRARTFGYVTTLFDRRRFLPEINSSNAPLRSFAERTAVNTPIQGTAADLIKVAMINIARVFAEKGLKSAMIMQVHDELVFEVPLEEKDEVIRLVKGEMEGVGELAVPLKVDIGLGENWDEAHS